MARFLRVIECPTQEQLLHANGTTDWTPGMQEIHLVHFGEDGPGLEFVHLRYRDIDDQMGWITHLQPWAQDEALDMKYVD